MPSSVEQIEEVFHAVLSRPAADRDRYLLESCSGNAMLYDEVCSLVAAWERDGDFLREPALETGLALLSQAPKKSLVGKTIGNYKINSLLGRGGMGEVYLAVDLRLERKVALKFLSREVAVDRSTKSQIINEARAAAKVDHPNICHIYGLEDFEDNTFIVMQYVPGITLADLIRKGPISKKHLFNLIRQIVSALSEAHSQGIVHRDIKPQNIMVTPNGQVKLLDFGLARSITDSDVDVTNRKRPSKPRAVPGTIRYMSPEQLRGENLDSRSDVFSLGTLLYEMVSGANPFARKSDREVVSAILSAVPNPFVRSSARIKPFALIVQRCLAKNPKERYSSANEVLSDLDKCVRRSRLFTSDPHQCSCFAV